MEAVILAVLILLVLVVLGVLVGMFKTQSRLNHLEKKMPEMQAMDSLSRRIQEADRSNRESFERLSGRLGDLSRATEQMMEVGKTISSLEDLLKPPKLRGGMGETMLVQLLEQILPEQHYDVQHAFKGGDVVDAAIRLGDGIVPVDSKFPLEQFRRMADAEDEATARKERRAFIRTVKKHIDDIANKYILPDEGTYDFALMFIPAENVYYETVIKDEQGEELFPYAVEKRVIPVSPNSFYAYLQVLIHGLKGLRIEERARAIMDHLSRLQGEEARFREEFNVLGTHLKNARNKHEDAERQLNRFEDKLLSASAVDNPVQLLPGKE